MFITDVVAAETYSTFEFSVFVSSCQFGSVEDTYIKQSAKVHSFASFFAAPDNVSQKHDLIDSLGFKPCRFVAEAAPFAVPGILGLLVVHPLFPGNVLSNQQSDVV